MQILWFRNDLRIHDNPALVHFIENKKAGDKAVFFLTPEQWHKHDWSKIKIDLILRHIKLLQQQLDKLHISFEIIEVKNFDDQREYFTLLNSRVPSLHVIANQELEFNERVRDRQCIKSGIDLTLFECDVIVPKGKVLNQSGSMFKVYTPFKKAWIKYIRANGFDHCPTPSNNTNGKIKPAIDVSKDALVLDKCLSKKWPLVTDIIKEIYPNFLEGKIGDYPDNRDIPAVKGTSGLSPYLAIGALSPRYLLTVLLSRFSDLLIAVDSKEFVWLNELIWREFYRHLLHHFPKLNMHKVFNSKYENTKWRYNERWFTAWCLGQTGYPIVDAAMRQLNQTGWMHNRLRMIVASFLTKHLLIDWRLGEKYFMSTLIDGDLAANNGGWQWAASTGCDAQPYFRIFNPIRQSEKFDPDGHFIRKYIPELINIPNKHIHFPHKYLSDNNIDTYWPALVEHKEARLQALDFYR